MRKPRTARRADRRIILLPLLLGALATSVTRPSASYDLPQHCDDLIHGDCARPWHCIVVCLMEMWGMEDFCDQYPNSPRCL
jgi:hypothetical protein